MMQAQIQAAIFAKLQTVGTVYDHVPQESAFPYIVIGDDTSTPWDTDDSTGSESTCTIHVWSRQRGRKEVKTIMQAIYDAMHRQELTITGGALVECAAEFQESFLDPDGITRHGVIRFRLITEGIS